MYKTRSVGALFVFALCSYPALAESNRPDMSGTWQLNAAKSQTNGKHFENMVWVIEQKDDQIEVREQTPGPNASNTTVEIKCGTLGKECPVRDGKREGTVAFWYNGPKLVEMLLWKDDQKTATKKRLALSPDQTSLTVEYIYIVPPGRPPDVLVFDRVQ